MIFSSVKNIFSIGSHIPKNSFVRRIDWVMFFSAVLVALAGLVTMNSFIGTNYFFDRQAVWISLGILVFFISSLFDYRFLRRTSVIFSLFVGACLLLVTLFFLGHTSKGAQSWFNLGFFSFQPSDPVGIVIILLLAKYFNRRHIEIGNIRHILISGLYAFLAFILVAIQPDFGSAIIILIVWFGMVMVSGISKKHLLAVILVGLASFLVLWFYVFHDYQKQRIITFIHPMADVRGAGYNAYQSTIAIGSGGVLGKGLGYGTQSKLQFLPEYETDFVFAAFAEEWGFVGAIILLLIFSLLVWRILSNAFKGDSNFEILFGVGLSILFTSHFVINIGMNMGLLPVTGITVPFMSYGGSHIITEFLGLGILTGMRGYGRIVRKSDIQVLGV